MLRPRVTPGKAGRLSRCDRVRRVKRVLSLIFTQLFIPAFIVSYLGQEADFRRAVTVYVGVGGRNSY